MRGATQQAPRRCLGEGISNAEHEPERKQQRVALNDCPKCKTTDKNQGSCKHGPAIWNFVQQTGKDKGGQHRAATECRKRQSRCSLRKAEFGLHQDDGINDDHGAGRSDRKIQGQKPAQAGCGKIDAEASRRAIIDAAPGRCFRARQDFRNDKRCGCQKADDRSRKQL